MKMYNNVSGSARLMVAKGLFLAVILSAYPMVGAQAGASSSTKVVSPKVKAESQIKENLSPKDAVMIIRFNQPNVYFQDSLKKMVDAVSGIKANVEYDIQSVIPVGKEDIGNKYKEYNQNLRLVVAGLGELGVSIDNIKIDITESSAINNHEIRIFIR